MHAIKLFSPNSNGEVDMAWLSSGRGTVIYLHPGWTPGQGGKRSAIVDAVQARAFEAQRLQLTQMGWRLAGVSTQEPGEQLTHIQLGEAEHIVLAVEHIVLVDPQLRLARELGLPAYSAGGTRRCYPRLALIAEQGFITHVLPLHVRTTGASQWPLGCATALHPSHHPATGKRWIPTAAHTTGGAIACREAGTPRARRGCARNHTVSRTCAFQACSFAPFAVVSYRLVCSQWSRS
jgi:peroxiredoxin